MTIYGVAATGFLLACTLACTAQQSVPCGQTLDVPLRPGAVLAITSLPAGVDIVGTERESVHVSCVADAPGDVNAIHLESSGTPARARLEITGARVEHDTLRIRIEVPRRVDLEFHMSAGQVKLAEVVGDKDISVTAGQITILSAHDWDYRVVDASVNIGEVNAPVYNANKGGFFRTVRKEDGTGRYRLHAHVTTGQIDLLRSETHGQSASQ